MFIHTTITNNKGGEPVRGRKKQKCLYDENGGVMSFVVVLILSMTLLATASMTVAKTQLTMSRFGRQTSNSYYLARSGAEKLVDTMNKEIAVELPRLMEEANKAAHNQLLAEDATKDGFTYEFQNGQPYLGKYVSRTNENEYKIKLMELIYDHIFETFIKNPDKSKTMDYKAYSDVSKNIPIIVTGKIYSNHSKDTQKIPEDIKDIVNNLATKNDIGITTPSKDAFVVEVIAQAKEGTKTSLTKSRVIGTIGLEELLEDDEFLEEYVWATDENGKRTIYPETLQAGIISFGDFIIQGDYKATINGDIQVKGTQRKATRDEYITGNFPEPDQWGGITVSDGGNLILKENALTISNIQTVNSWGYEGKTTQITIGKDAIAHTIAIHDNYYEGHLSNQKPWEKNNYVKNNKINIGWNAYVDNDIRIDRYVDKGEIKIKGSVFAISDGDQQGVGGVGTTIVDPNKSSGVFSLGEESIISMGKAFIAGQSFVNFGDGKGYHRLHESVGEPFQDVYYLEEYREQYGHSDQYIHDFEDIINTDKIKIEQRKDGNPYAYAPAYVSEQGGKSYDVKEKVGLKNQGEAIKLFYSGYDIGPDLGEKWHEDLVSESDFDTEIPGTHIKWGNIVGNPFDFYTGTNSYQKKYIPADTEPWKYALSREYKGLQGYMLTRRGVFYSKLQESTTTPNQYQPIERQFEDFVDMSEFKEFLDKGSGKHKWSYNNPIYITSESEAINISQFKKVETAIVCTNPDTTITLEGTGVFNGIIITPGKVEIGSNMIINGTIIAGNECDTTTPSREEIQAGTYAGVQISADNVEINYDPDMLLKIRFMDKSLQRRLYDSLKITNYKAVSELEGMEQENIDTIMGSKGDRKIKLSPTSVISSKQGGLKFVMRSLRKR